MQEELNFDYKERDNLVLILPRAKMGSAYAPWNKENIWWRSRIVNKEGIILSQGFGKFFNLDAGPSDVRVTANDVLSACSRNDAVATIKIDGSLLIRSVIYSEEIMIRTRNSFGCEVANADEITLFKEKYPELFNPSNFSTISILLEWVSPKNQIVIHYSQPELYLVGAINHSERSTYCSMDKLKEISDIIKVPVVEHFKLNPSGWSELLRKVIQEDNIEGYVIRINKEQKLVKMKSHIYLAKHAFRYEMTVPKLVDIWFNCNQPSYQTFSAFLRQQYDEECVMWAIPLLSVLFDAVTEVNKIVDYIKKQLGSDIIKGATQKEVALFMQEKYGNTLNFSIAMAVFVNKSYNNQLKKLILQKAKYLEKVYVSRNESEH